jgi:hypothetical protein
MSASSSERWVVKLAFGAKRFFVGMPLVLAALAGWAYLRQPMFVSAFSVGFMSLAALRSWEHLRYRRLLQSLQQRIATLEAQREDV